MIISNRSHPSDGDVTITYGVSQEVIDDLRKTLRGQEKAIERLLKNLDEKDIAVQERDGKIQEWIKKYKELEIRLAKRSTEDILTAQANKRLEAGDLEGTEKLLRRSLEKNLQALDEKKKAAAADAYELGSLRELQLDYHGASKFYEQAVQLEPQNSEYLNSLGLILYNFGEAKKAIEYYTKALEIFTEIYGSDHPSTRTVKANLDSLS